MSSSFGLQDGRWVVAASAVRVAFYPSIFALSLPVGPGLLSDSAGGKFIPTFILTSSLSVVISVVWQLIHVEGWRLYAQLRLSAHLQSTRRTLYSSSDFPEAAKLAQQGE